MKYFNTCTINIDFGGPRICGGSSLDKATSSYASPTLQFPPIQWFLLRLWCHGALSLGSSPLVVVGSVSFTLSETMEREIVLDSILGRSNVSFWFTSMDSSSIFTNQSWREIWDLLESSVSRATSLLLTKFSRPIVSGRSKSRYNVDACLPPFLYTLPVPTWPINSS